MILLSLLSRTAMLKMRNKLLTAGKIGKQIMGAIMLLIGIMILTGFDKQLESVLVQASPDWLNTLTTRF